MEKNINRTVRKFVAAHKIKSNLSKTDKFANLMLMAPPVEKVNFLFNSTGKCKCEKRLSSDGLFYVLLKYRNGIYEEVEEFKTKEECDEGISACS